MAIEGFSPSAEYRKISEQYGEDTFLKLNQIYLAFEMDEINDDGIQGGEFDDLCEDVLEIALDPQFESYNLIDIADAVVFIIHDSNYTVREYETSYKKRRDTVCEELLAYLESTRRRSLEGEPEDGEPDGE